MTPYRKLAALAEIGQAGLCWYDDARDYIDTVCQVESLDKSRFIDIMAITSPRVSVITNWNTTLYYMKHGTLGWGTIKSTRTALAHYEQTHEIRGPKTSAFARALHGDTTALVLDIWMARALDVDPRKVTSKANMQEALTLVKRVAHANAWHVRDTQAAIWWGVCMTHGVKPGNLQSAAQGSSQMGWEF